MGVSNYDITAAALHLEQPQDYELSILTGVDSFAYIIRDRTANRLLAYRSYAFDAAQRADWPATLGQLVAADERLRTADFGRTVVAWDTPTMVLVPRPLFTEGHPATYLEQLTVIGLDDEVRHERLQEIGSELIFAARRAHLDAVEEHFGGGRPQHFTGGLLTAWAARSRRLGQSSVSCAVRGPRLFVAGHRNGILEYYNAFSFASPQDAVYYLLLAYEQCGFSPARVPLYLCGEVTAAGEVYHQFYQYVEDLRFSVYATPPAAPPEFDGLPPHLYFDLLCLR